MCAPYSSLPSSSPQLPRVLRPPAMLPPNPIYVAVALAAALIFFSSLHTSAAADGDTLAAGQALAAGDKLVSRNGKFALGFFQFRQTLPGGGSDDGITNSTIISSPGWYLGVWFNKIPVCTPVWIANRDRPITESELKVSQLRISTSDGNKLIVTNNTSTDESPIWSSAVTVTVTNSTTNASSVHAVLMNTGNLALLPAETISASTAAAPTSSSYLWQSFDYPTDVGLPGAKIGWNKVAGGKPDFDRQFISKKSLIDPSPGSYSINIDPNGFMQLTTRNAPFVTYWSWTSGRLEELVPALTALINMDLRTKGLLVPDYVETADEVYFTYSITNESASVFVPIDITGQLKLMLWSEAKQSWETIYAQPSDFCLTFGVCGPFTVCNGNSGSGTSSSCGCMETFSLTSPRDWGLSDLTGGCARRTPLDCKGSTNRSSSSSGSTDVFHPIAQVALPYNPRGIEGAAAQSDCAEACLGDCNCTAYSYSNNGKCSVWHGDLLSVNKADNNSISSQDVLYLRLAKSDFQSLNKTNKKTPAVAIAASAVGSGLLVLMLVFLIWRNRFRWCNAHSIQDGGGGIIAFKYTDLSRATKNFSERIGGGGFGSVFKGVLSDSTAIAVKRLDDARQGEKQFRAEVSSIGMIQHINLVKLIGFCCEGDKRLLVYEHVVNGSLDAHLFQSNAAVLNWSRRYKIAIGVARGLCYLHQSCHECIIHCDIKPENILLDSSFAPKISDFGMAAFVGRDFSRVLTTFRGTAGYLAPEWLSAIPITPKVDVYSFGMVVLEIISGKRNTPEVFSKSSYHVAYFPVQAIRKLHEGDLQSLVDPQLQEDLNLEEAERLCKVAFWCIQDNECDRPTMVDVVRVLEGLQELDMPPMPRLLAAITERANAELM
ncbi:hypothetical protein BDA96_09G019900 [Sorghum bicolor]|uniref:Receptor-like serine/threonine-protein kinase n=1 Tax=Sorghum bicolor TaxID=4558 RepID=A0A921Q7U5_SORBI|nr:hypothetical protein BDA96_09G019900 [Sorghum bicolor]